MEVKMAMSDKEDEDMKAHTPKERLEQANANYQKIRLKVWEIARKNTEEEKKEITKPE
jgi:hypothetical protein